MKSDILIKGRHYSGEVDTEEFLAAVQPQLLVATSVDFPTRERVPDDWAQKVRQRGITLFRQDETGAVKLEFFDSSWRATPFLDPQQTLRSSSR